MPMAPAQPFHPLRERNLELLRPALFHLRPQRPGDRVRGVPAGARRDGRARRYAGDAGLWRLQREALPGATVVLDWWHAAVRFEHALQAARGLGVGTADTHFASEAVRRLERAKWRLWHGRGTGCRHKLAALCRWTERKHMRDVTGIGRLQRHASELLGYLERNEHALVHYAARRRWGEPISTAFVESTVNEIVAKRMNKKQQMRWNRTTVQPFLDVRTAVLNDTLEDAFRHRHPGFRPANDDHRATTAAA